MQAENFKSVDDLDISEPMRNALIVLLSKMEGGEVQHYTPARDYVQSRGSGDIAVEQRSPVRLFNMGFWALDGDGRVCDTIMCIGGACEVIMGHRCAEYSRGLHELFYPPVMIDLWGAITVAQSAAAIRNYLTTGHADWHRIMEMG